MLLFLQDGYGMSFLGDTQSPTYINDESRLHSRFFQRKREAHPTGGAMPVYFGIILLSIVDYDAVDEKIVITANIKQSWVNPHIKWDPEKYGGIKMINVRPKNLWLPDIYAFGDVEARVKYNGMLDTMTTNVMVMYNGSQIWIAPITMALGCGMNVKDYPFDAQACALLFGSFTHDNKKLILVPEETVIQANLTGTQWVLQSVTHEQKIFHYSDSNFSDLQYTIVIKRKVFYSFFAVLMPKMILIMLTLVVFVQPIASKERCSYVITIFMALTWFMMAAAENLPASSEGVPLSTLFLCISLLIMSVLVFYLSYGISIFYADVRTRKIPYFLREFVLNKLSMYLGCYRQRKVPLWKKNLDIVREYASCYRSSYFDDDEDYDFEKELCSRFGSTVSVANFLTISGIVDELLERFAREDDDEAQKYEWHVLADTLDHVCLYVCIMICVMMFVYCTLFAVYA